MIRHCSEKHLYLESLNAWVRTYGAGLRQTDPGSKNAQHQPASRPDSDALAAWLRWHEPAVLKNVSNAHRDWYLPFEQARVETLATRDLAGIASNLAISLERTHSATLQDLLYMLARCVFEGVDTSVEWFERQPSWRKLRRRKVRPFWSLFGARKMSAKSQLDSTKVLEFLKLASHEVGRPSAFFEILAPLIERLVTNFPAIGGGMQENTDQGMVQLEPSFEEDVEDSIADEFNITRHTSDAPPPTIERRYSGYRVFSTAWDEERPASYWLRAHDRQLLDAISVSGRVETLRLAHRFQRRLQAASIRGWEFGLEEGHLDNRRLARLIGDSPDSRIFREEKHSKGLDAFVTLLVDQSGSMKGERQRLAAMTLDIAVHTLESCNIPCEVLGFTTTAFEHVEIHQRWMRSKESDPGRLNALRHIIYKLPAQPWCRCRTGLGLMLRDDFGCENIDGEALDWAARRLSSRSEKKKVLVVLSDGCPFDKHTAQVNGRKFLDNHLREVIEEVEKAHIDLLAIGASSEIFRFYSRAKIVTDPADIAQQLFAGIAELLLPFPIRKGKI